MEPIATIPIRYDGIDAAEHQIDLLALSTSLNGMARVIAVCGQFVSTSEYVKRYKAMTVRVMVREPRANCFSLAAILEFAHQQQLLSGSVGTLLPALLGYVFARAGSKREEMKALKETLSQLIASNASGNEEAQRRMLGVIERLATDLRPAVKRAVAPVGFTCSSMTLPLVVIDEPTAEVIRLDEPAEVGESREWHVVITELDAEKRSAKIRLVDEPIGNPRIRAVITDPSAMNLPNYYAAAFSSGHPIKVLGKPVLVDGEVRTIYISDAL